MLQRVTAALLVCGLIGCASAVTSSGTGGTVPDYLAAAEEDGEFTGILTEPVPPPIVPVREKPRSFGVRAGLFMPVAADEGTWGPSFSASLYYRKVKQATRRQAIELGLDYSMADRDDGTVSSQLISVGGEMLFGNWEKGKDGVGIYFLGGADLVTEIAEITSTGQSDTALGVGLNLGVGLGPSTGMWDFRAVYTLFPGSGNVGGNILVAAGYSF